MSENLDPSIKNQEPSIGITDSKTDEFQYSNEQQIAIDHVMLKDTIQTISNKLEYERPMSEERRAELTERLHHLESDLENLQNNTIYE